MELEEAGMVDGCSRFTVIVRIVLPLAVPAVIVTLIFSFLLAWNEVLFASALTNNATRTLGIGLQGYLAAGEAGGQVYWNQLMGASLGQLDSRRATLPGRAALHRPGLDPRRGQGLAKAILVREQRDPVIRGEDALHALAVIQAIYEAERSGKPVDVQQTVLA